MTYTMSVAFDANSQTSAQQQEAAREAAQAREIARDVRNAARDAARAKADGLSEQQIEKQVQQAVDQAIAQAQGGAPTPPTPPPPGFYYSSQNPYVNNDIPPQVPEILTILGVTLVFCVVGFPIARALARWIDRRGVSAPVPQEVTKRLEAIESAVESIAVEVERISEGQRFTTRVLTERTQEPAPVFGASNLETVPLAAPSNSTRR